MEAACYFAALKNGCRETRRLVRVSPPVYTICRMHSRVYNLWLRAALLGVGFTPLEVTASKGAYIWVIRQSPFLHLLA